jgi:hypothetical protein
MKLWLRAAKKPARPPNSKLKLSAATKRCVLNKKNSAIQTSVRCAKPKLSTTANAPKWLAPGPPIVRAYLLLSMLRCTTKQKKQPGVNIPTQRPVRQNPNQTAKSVLQIGNAIGTRASNNFWKGRHKFKVGNCQRPHQRSRSKALVSAYKFR